MEIYGPAAEIVMSQVTLGRWKDAATLVWDPASPEFVRIVSSQGRQCGAFAAQEGGYETGEELGWHWAETKARIARALPRARPGG